MKLESRDIDKIERFLENIREDIYPEHPTATHTEITERMFDHFNNRYRLQPNSKVLDIGCGQGVALDLFARQGFSPIGVTLDEQDLSICIRKGYEVYEMDQSFLDFDDQVFDFVWCRHCIEHSIFPEK
jgi:cyclopropane fatty-acyl-phospholipid synthase-like methyltransferase